MDLLDRYIHAVRFWLPRDQEDDVAAELAEDIRSQIEEQESGLGRTLTEPEVEALLKQRGRPVMVASRYRRQEYLIGPALFPVYRFVVVVVALCYLAPWTVAWLGMAIFDPHHASFGRTFGPLWGTFWVNAFVALGTVTLVFAILERVQPNLAFLNDWNPRALPAVRDANRIGRVSSAIALAANLAFAVWWVTDMWSTTVFDRGGVRITLAPVWKEFLWIFLVMAVASSILAIANLARPYWTWLRASIQLALTVAGCVTFCALCRAGILSEIVAPNLPPARAAQIVHAFNVDASKMFPIAVLVSVVIVGASDVGRLIRLYNRGKRVVTGAAHREA